MAEGRVDSEHVCDWLPPMSCISQALIQVKYNVGMGSG